MLSRVLVTMDGVLHWLIGFINTLYNQLKLTAIADLHNSYHLSVCVFIGALSSTGHRADRIENTSQLSELLCYLATSCSAVHREHRSCCCVFAGTCILSRCPAMDVCVTIYFCNHRMFAKGFGFCYLQSHSSSKCLVRLVCPCRR
jgi:hypothetical protein